MKLKHLPASFFLVATMIYVAAGQAQSPTPLVVQAASPTTAVSKAAPAGLVETSPSITAALKTLKEAKAANAETLKKQEATLEKLDDMQKAADQLKIFARRGGGKASAPPP